MGIVMAFFPAAIMLAHAGPPALSDQSDAVFRLTAPASDLWGVQFNYNAFDVTGMDGHAAVVYLQDRGESVSLVAAQAKLFAAETANFCVDRAVQIHGGYGFIGEFSPVEKLYRDQRFLEIGEGTSEIQRMVIARTILDGSGN